MIVDQIIVAVGAINVVGAQCGDRDITHLLVDSR